METLDDRVPVTLLSGFLGAGKTTLLNHLIRDPDAGRIAVIMNEFGDVGLDHDLIEEVTDDIVLMHAGCLCCSIRGDLAKTMILLLSRRKRGQLTFDRVVIETTGIADPAPILNTMVTNDLIADNYRPDGVVVLADAATGQGALDTQFEAVRQIAMADLIVVTKSDLVTEDACAAFERRLGEMNSAARRVRGARGRVAPGTLFGLSAMRTSASAEAIGDWLGTPAAHGAPSPTPSPTPAPIPARTPFETTPAEHRVNSASIEVEEPIPANVFDFWLDTLMALRGPDILRIKGIVHVEGMDWPFVFHGVQHIFEAPVPLKSWTGTGTTSRVVVIARDMEKDEIAASLQVLRMRQKEVDAPPGGMMAHTTEMPF
ncbi:MAG: GTP-binding protein [Pseudomonadota bacterium]